MSRRVLAHATTKGRQGARIEPGSDGRRIAKHVGESPESSFYARLGRECQLCRDALILRSRGQQQQRRGSEKDWTAIARRLASSAAELRPSEAAVLCHFLGSHLPEDNKYAKDALTAVAATHFYSKLQHWTGKELAMWSSAATVHRPLVTREAYRVFFDHIEKNLHAIPVDDAVVLVSALGRSKEKIHSSLRKHINGITRGLVQRLPESLPTMTPKSIAQIAQLVTHTDEDSHNLLMEEIPNRDDVPAASWAQFLRIYAEGHDAWINRIWSKIVDSISSSDGKTTAMILNALARAHSKAADVRRLDLTLGGSANGWDVHSAAISCISLARLGQTQNAIGTAELDRNFAKLEDFLLAQDLSRSNLLQLKQIALGFSLASLDHVSNGLWRSIAVAASDARLPGSGEDRIGVLGSLSAGYPLGKATKEIEHLARSIPELIDLSNVSHRSFHLLIMKLVKMRYFPTEVMAKVEGCIEKDPGRLVPNGEAVLSLIHYLFACNSDGFGLWKIAVGKLDELHEEMSTEDLFASVGFMTTCNRRPSEQVAADVLARLSEPPNHQDALMALMSLCRADLALRLPVHDVGMRILASMRAAKPHVDVLQDCVDMLCQVALLSGSSQLIRQVINDLSRVSLRNTNMSWIAWSAAMLDSLDLIPTSLLRSMLRVNLDYRHPVAGFCRDSRMAQRVHKTLNSIGCSFSAECESGGFRIDFVSAYESVFLLEVLAR
ncbi:hypothetical protein FOZ63_022580 [Perkinsus olseni]|uniref:Uncharacterized protein n=3 Tax=Perkinsus olseni TaxID=32597 RepID=A0A7J6TCZ4_PEROL|nr:hypothetical protein FOZ63_022580 [Perkinsus olseni]